MLILYITGLAFFIGGGIIAASNLSSGK